MAQTECTDSVSATLCEIVNEGDSGQLTIASRVRVINTGSITGAPAIIGTIPVPPTGVPTLITLIIENRAGATIIGTGGVSVNSPGALINAGTITGNVTGLTQYVADGGTLNGNLTLGTGAPTDFNPQIFVQRGATPGVTGTISAGSGIDYYVQSYAASETLPILLGGGLPATFEVEGVEVRGAATTVTLASLPGETIGGLGLMGDGHIVSTATIGVSNTVGAGFPPGFPLFTTAVSYLGSPEATSFLTLRIQTSPPGAPLQFATYQTGIGAALGSLTNEGTINGDLRLTTAGFANNGTINLVTRATGTLIANAEAADFSFSNSGTISYVDNGARAGLAAIEGQYLGDGDAGYAVRLRSIEGVGAQGVTIANSGTLEGGLGGALIADTLSFENSGDISGIESANALAHGVNLTIGSVRRLDGSEAGRIADNVTIANTATGTINDGLRVSAATTSLSFTNAGAITGRSDDNRAVSIDHEGGEGLSFGNSGTIAGDLLVGTDAAQIDVVNSGSIVMPVVAGFDPNSGSREAVEIGLSATGNQDVEFTNSGGIEQRNRGGAAVSIELEENQTATIDIANSGAIRSDAGASVIDGTLVGLEEGTQAVNVSVGLAVSAGEGGRADITIDNRAGGTISASGAYAFASADGETPAPGGSTAYSTALLVDADSLTLTNAGTISGGEGATLPDGYVLTRDFALPDNYLAGAIQTGASVDRVTNTETGEITGSVDLGAGDDSFANYGTITGDIFLRNGNDSYIHLLAASFTGTADGGAGEDSLAIDLTGSDGVVSNALYEQFINFELFSLISNGTGIVLEDGGTLDLGEDSRIDTPGETAIQGGDQGDTVSNSGTINGNVDLGGGGNTFTNNGTITGNIATGAGNDRFSNTAGGTITGNVDLGDGDDSFANAGEIIGDVALGGGADTYELGAGSVSGVVDLGQGDDRLTLGSGASFGGAVSGGAGTDVLGLATAGTAAAPYEFNAAGFTDFERLTNVSGTAAISGTVSFGQIEVAAGRLIGRAGSVLTGNVAVANGATFGSAGTVNGNVTVASGGTLSPGASPGVMTVNGNVSLAGGTTTIFEFQPSPLQSDQLLISGTLTIAGGTTLRLTGDRPLTPGVAYDLIVATGGITGTFTTVDQAATVLGFLRYSADRLQLLGTFQAGAGVSPQVAASIDYVNAVLVAGASTDLLAAVPALLASDGTANAAAFALIGPEAYASASELGSERGLGLVKAARAGLGSTGRAAPGPFAFGQAQGGWRDLEGEAQLGISGADIESYGVFGGMGYGSRNGSIAAFVGTVDSEQRLPGIAARTDANGIVVGLVGRFASGGFDLSAMAAYDWGDAETERAVPANGSVSASYRLRSLVLDAAMGYALPISNGWALRPEIGITHVATERGATGETGSPAFALAVEGDDRNATFVDGSIGLKGGLEADAASRPWIQAGVRHQVSGGRASATGGFAGNPLTFALPGAARAETLALFGAGASFDIGSGTSLYAAYQGELGEGGSHNVNLGIRIAF
ncbi:autotransporter domain-containing protein [Sphingosinicella sp. LHD-64]|uniref:autotransporter domain-containing protein n=1 Tax=Sphingosinicella sp. LHD-64 TaxID=3072139 RepID=UPI00280C8FBA|nr:autotransporter domain-containing protein [Sphingosinicella sp. LHD-64]MDQ8757357.1 autotransporter domain-containing protein [Sphingosinicella sp. LHD-64]